MPKRLRSASLSSTSSTTGHSPSSADVPPNPSKYTHLIDEPPLAVMQCSLPPHPPLPFPTYAAYDVHYAQIHTNRCSECRRNFPTEHSLHLHIAENHDPISEALRAKGEKTYHCFVPDCDKVCLTPQKRRLHLIDKHLFPKNYDFQYINTGIDKRASLLRPHHRRHSSAAERAVQRRSSLHQPALESGSVVPATDGESGESVATTKVEGCEVGGDQKEGVVPSQQRSRAQPSRDEVDSLADSLSALKFVPPSVRFGRGGRRGGLARS